MSYDFKELLKHFTGYAPVADTLPCPFHQDNRKSAKIYNDKDGDRLWCFTENRMFYPCDLIERFGGDPADWLTDEIKNLQPTREIIAVDVEPLMGFKAGLISLEEFFLRCCSLKEKVQG